MLCVFVQVFLGVCFLVSCVPAGCVFAAFVAVYSAFLVVISAAGGARECPQEIFCRRETVVFGAELVGW